MMLRLLIVDAVPERCAGLVDAVCELPGIEVRATASDVTSALAQLDRVYCDVVVGASDLPGTSIVTLIDGARRHGVSHILVMATRQPLLGGIVEYWQDVGAHHVINSQADLVTCLTELAALPDPTFARALIAPRAHVHRPAPLVEIADVLRKAIRGWGGLIPPEIELHLETSPDLPRVQCEPRDLELLALHLVLDSCRALPLGGTVWLCVERTGTRHVRIEVIDSSGRPRVPGAGAVVLRTLTRRYHGELRTIDLGGGATSLEVTLPAVVNLAS